MGVTARTGLTWEYLRDLPEENWVKHELFDGELAVSWPTFRHQTVLGELLFVLGGWARGTGAVVAPGTDLKIADDRVVIPDAIVVFAERVPLFDGHPLMHPPDVAIEISSPSTRRCDLFAKRAYYEQFGVKEYWFLDLGKARILVYALCDGAYGEPRTFERGDLLESHLLKGLRAPVDDLLGSPQHDRSEPPTPRG